MKDYRLLENRIEGFIRTYHWRVETGDLSYPHASKVAAEVLDLDEDGKIWFAFLFGHCYSIPMAMIYIKEFPRVEDLDIEKAQEWTNANFRKLIYGDDCKWQKGKFPTVVKGIQSWVGQGTLRSKVESLVDQNALGYVNFKRLYKEVLGLPQYGRMTTWLTLEVLFDVSKLKINHCDLLMENGNTWSPYNGLCALYGLENLKRTKEFSPSKNDISVMDKNLHSLLRLMESSLPYREVSIYAVETHLCQYKKWTERSRGDYDGESSAKLNELYFEFEKKWPEKDLLPYLMVVMSVAPTIRGLKYNSKFSDIFPERGLFLNTSDMFPDMPDVYRELGIKKDEWIIQQLFDKFGAKNLNFVEKNYSPKKYLSYK